MTENLCISNGSKEEEYHTLLPRIRRLITDENDLVTNLASIAAALKEISGFFWVRFCLVKGEGLVLAPFQGPVACIRIEKGRGVCGKAWERTETLVVPGVDAFPGHAMCSSSSRSETVVPPPWIDGELWGVLDMDCESLNGFNDMDAYFLHELYSCL